jgi:putative phosphoribosyl transferase
MTRERSFRDRRQAGRILASQLQGLDLGPDPVILALPRGGVPVAAEIAGALHLPLEVFLVRKLGAPGQPEFAMGAIASGGVELLNKSLIAQMGFSRAEVAAVIQREQQELHRRERVYRPEGPLVIASHAVIIVDDGLATGFTMRAAVAALRKLDCPRLIVAVPVGAKSTCEQLAQEVDRLVCPLQPDEFVAVGMWYEDFSATSDEEVQACLARTVRVATATPAGGRKTP